MEGRLEQKSQFELIFQNLEESLVIISNKKMQLVNREFLAAFRQIIMQTHENISNAQSLIDIQQDTKSQVGKFKDKIRSMFFQRGREKGEL